MNKERWGVGESGREREGEKETGEERERGGRVGERDKTRKVFKLLTEVGRSGCNYEGLNACKLQVEHTCM